MPALNFKAEFADQVKNLQKRQTIRARGKRNPPRVGDPLELDADMVALPGELEHIWPKLLVDMLDVSRAALTDAGAKDEQAREIAIIVLRSLARYHGGRSAYLPTGDTLDEALKHYRIWRESWKLSVRELSVKYDMTEVHIYRIIARQKALARARVQPDLFPAAPTQN